MSKANTATQRVELLRARRAERGLTRLDLYVHTEDHAAVKAFVQTLNDKRFGINPQVQPVKKETVKEEGIQERLAKQAEEARNKFFKVLKHEI